MTVSPTSAAAGSTGNTLNFTFTAPAEPFESGSEVTSGSHGMDGTENRQQQRRGNRDVHTRDALAASQTITVLMACAAGTSFTISYADATAQTTTGTATFTTETLESGGVLTAITTSPTVTINAGPAYKLVFTTSPSASTVAGTAFSTQPVVQVGGRQRESRLVGHQHGDFGDHRG